MSTERIDHAAKAREHITEWMDADFHAGVAQVHATLALVEQQRIANLLALAQFQWDGGGKRLYTTEVIAKAMRNEASMALRGEL